MRITFGNINIVLCGENFTLVNIAMAAARFHISFHEPCDRWGPFDSSSVMYPLVVATGLIIGFYVRDTLTFSNEHPTICEVIKHAEKLSVIYMLSIPSEMLIKYLFSQCQRIASRASAIISVKKPETSILAANCAKMQPQRWEYTPGKAKAILEKMSFMAKKENHSSHAHKTTSTKTDKRQSNRKLAFIDSSKMTENNKALSRWRRTHSWLKDIDTTISADCGIYELVQRALLARVHIKSYIKNREDVIVSLKGLREGLYEFRRLTRDPAAAATTKRPEVCPPYTKSISLSTVIWVLEEIKLEAEEEMAKSPTLKDIRVLEDWIGLLNTGFAIGSNIKAEINESVRTIFKTHDLFKEQFPDFNHAVNKAIACIHNEIEAINRDLVDRSKTPTMSSVARISVMFRKACN